MDMVASGGDKAFIKHNLSRLQSIQSNLGQKSSIFAGDDRNLRVQNIWKLLQKEEKWKEVCDGG